MKKKRNKKLQLFTYEANLGDVIDVLIGIEPKTKDWDESILRAIRVINEIKQYFHKQICYDNN